MERRGLNIRKGFLKFCLPIIRGLPLPVASRFISGIGRMEYRVSHRLRATFQEAVGRGRSMLGCQWDVPAISRGRAMHSHRAATIGACDRNLNEQPFWIVSFTGSCRLPNGNGCEMTASSVVRPRTSPIVTFTYRVGHNSPRRLTNNSSGSKA